MVFKYPKFGRIAQIEPNPTILLGHEIWWTLKEDGSNFGVYVSEEGKIRVRSRNQDVATFEDQVKNVPEFKNIVALIDHLNSYNLNVIVFGELLAKGTSPTGLVKNRLKDELKVFDIYDVDASKFINWGDTCILCYPFNIPLVETVGRSVCANLEQLNAFKDQMMEKTKGFEGVVGKVYEKPFDHSEDNYLFFKEKHSYPKPMSEQENKNAPTLPQLPETDLRACVYKVRDELSAEEFKSLKTVMPRIAAKVREECKEQNCSNRIPLDKMYFEVLESLD